MSSSRANFRRSLGIYAILDSDTVQPGLLPEFARMFADAGIRLFQVRAKKLASGPYLSLCENVKQALQGRALVLANDRPDIALLAGLDGVHVGDEDLPPEEARKIIGDDKVLGCSTHSLGELAAVDPKICDYAGFGPVFPSQTKVTGRPVHGIEGLARACKIARVPVVAIGGITVGQIPAIKRAGAAGIAMVSALLLAQDPAGAANAAVEAFSR